VGVQTIDEFVAGFPRAGGFVYILTNEAHPHLQKIGFSTRSPAERAAELDRTGSAQPFVVAFALYHADPRVAEQRLHAALAAQRVRDEREFFAIPLADAVAIIMREFGANASYFDPYMINRPARNDSRRCRGTLSETSSSMTVR
jgi:T5orf172 domain-containing protein